MLVTQHRVRTKHCMYYCFVLKRKVLRFRDVDIYFFSSQSREAEYDDLF